MQDIYYVQPSARRLLLCLHKKDYSNLPVHPRYLNGLDELQFWRAFGELRDIFEDFYKQAVEHPENTTMLLYELDKYDRKSKEAKAGHTALLSFPITLFTLAVASVWENNVLTVNHVHFKEAIKIMGGSKTSEQIQRFCEHGFVFSEWNGKKFLTNCESFTMDYPDNPNILIVIAAIGDKITQYRKFQEDKQEKILNSHSGLGSIEQFVQFDPNIYVTDSGALPSKTLNHMMNTVGESNGQLLSAVVEEFKKRGLELRFGVCFVGNNFHDKKGKDTLNSVSFGHYSMGIRTDEPLTLRVKLIRINQYIEKIEVLPLHLKARFDNVKCQNCSEKCTRKIIYTLNGKKKIACACETFTFNNFSADDIDTLMELYDAEQLTRATK